MSWVLVIILSIRGQTYKEKRTTISAQLIIIVVCCRKKCKEKKMRMSECVHYRLLCKQIDIHKKGQWQACSSLSSSFFQKSSLRKKVDDELCTRRCLLYNQRNKEKTCFFCLKKIKCSNKKSYVKGDRDTI